MAWGQARQRKERVDQERDIRAEEQRANESWGKLLKALPEVELRGTSEARILAQRWVEELTASYDEAYEFDLFNSRVTREIEQ
jgi:hypothetical protein